MRTHHTLAIAGLALAVVGCQNPMAPPPANEDRPAVFPTDVNLQTGPANQCRGAFTSEFATDWPWPSTREQFPPPPGAIALFVKNFGPIGGFSSVREMQEFFCSLGGSSNSRRTLGGV